MADRVISVIGTVANKLPDLPIKDGQIIFVKDKKKVALDLMGREPFITKSLHLKKIKNVWIY